VHTVAKFALPAMLAAAEKSSGFCSRIWWLYSAFIFSKNMSVVGWESMISPTLIAVKQGANIVTMDRIWLQGRETNFAEQNPR